MKYIKLFEKTGDDVFHYITKDRSDYPDNESESNEDFVDYMADFYAGDAVFGLYFQNNLTTEIIKKYVDDFVNKRKELDKWGGGDSFDREYFRDLLFYKLDIRDLDELEYDITPYLTEFEIDTNKYNL